MISKQEATKIVEEYLKHPINQIEDVKIPIYKSWKKRFCLFLLRFYGKIKGRKYFKDAIIEPDEWKIISDKMVILTDGVWEGESCWMIWYNSKFYDDTNDLIYLRIGIGPMIVDKTNGDCYETGSGDDHENLIEEFTKFKNGDESLVSWESRRR